MQFVTHFLLIVLFVVHRPVPLDGAQALNDIITVKTPYTEDAECPRQLDRIANRKCLKKCRNDTDCRGRNKQCMCDDVCGKSCVKPTLRCESLKPIFHGKYEITPFNTFAAHARYTCNEGYILSGSAERICQGDGYWSKAPPTCETEGKCRDPPVVENAIHDGPDGQSVFPLGTQLTYTCTSGYNIDGFFRAMCVGEGRWVGPRMTCAPQRCGHPGEIPHGKKEGTEYIFPARVTYTCNHGYEMVGRTYRVCQANGKWSGESPPTCKPVRCPQLGDPPNGKMRGNDYTYGAAVHFDCFRGFRLIGSKSRRCEQHGHWSGQEVTCSMVDCGLPGPFYNGYLDGQQTTFGAVIVFRCFGRTTFDGDNRSTACQENGEWSNPVPKCWSKCQIPNVNNGTVEKAVTGSYVAHGTEVKVKCNEGHEPNSTQNAVCNNGTWSFVPECEPAPCVVRPAEISKGIVRFHGMRHGDKAKYSCNTGFKLPVHLGYGITQTTHSGVIIKPPKYAYLTCLYGQWRGEMPTCLRVFCKYPGVISHGKIMLVGAIGKYEYQNYVKDIGHSEDIEFQCDKGYKLKGPTAATCVDGRWSPAEIPQCVPGQHPKMHVLYRGKRDVSPIIGALDTKMNHMVVKRSRRDPDKRYCPYPGRIDNGKIMLVGRIGKYEYRPYIKHITENSLIEYHCNSGFELTGFLSSVCHNGTWIPQQLPTCRQTSRRSYV